MSKKSEPTIEVTKDEPRSFVDDRGAERLLERAAPTPPGGTIVGDPALATAASKPLEVGDAVKVWPHLGDRGCFSGPHRGVVAKVHMNDCVDVTATLVEGKREYERTYVGVVLVGSRGREIGDAGTFTVGG